MDLRFWAATDVGRVRGHNEDNFLVDKRLQLFVVCDGMGGHAAGEVASAVCVRTVRDVVAAEAELLTRMRENPGDPMGRQVLEQLLGRAIRTASARIHEMAQKDPSKRGMGTTCITLVMAGNRGFVGHVGDSRLYRIRNDEVEQVSIDHSLLNEMIRQGKIPATTTEAEFPHNNAVTRAVGVREAVDVETFQFEVLPGDRLMMCSDGLSEYFRGSVDVRALVGEGEPKETTARCIEHANRSGGKDNITVVVIDYGVEEDEEEKLEAAQVLEILQKTSYFHYLAPPELEHIRKLATRLEYEADERIVDEGNENENLFIILKGSVSLQFEGRQLSVLMMGEHFGELAVIDAQGEDDAKISATALEPTVVLAVGREQFMGLLRSTPGLAVKLLWNFVQVFADKVKAAPIQHRFGLENWHDEADEVEDETPPAGSLVFEEDLRRLEERSGAQDMGLVTTGYLGESEASEPEISEPDPDPLDFGNVGIGNMSSLVEEDEVFDPVLESRKTVDLGDVDFSQLAAGPPRMGVTGSALDDEMETPPPRSISEPAEMPETGQWLFNPEAFPEELRGGEGAESEGEEEGSMPELSDPLDMFLNESGDSSASEEEVGNRGSQSLTSQEGIGGKEEADLGATLELSPDLDHLKSLRSDASSAATSKENSTAALKEKLRARMKKGRTEPAAGVLKKASGRLGGGPEAVASAPSEPVKSNGSALSGSSVAGESKAAKTKSPPAMEQPKVMISPDLMADVDDD